MYPLHSKAKGAAPSAEDAAAQNWPGCFRHVARCRRLNKEEVVLILSDPLKFGLVRTEVLPAEGIANGTVYLCSKDRVRVLKHDGIDYVKRNAAQGSNRIREDVVKMKVNGRHAVNSYSSRGSGSACFWRRRYALEPPSVTGPGGARNHQTVTWGDQLVHYLDDEEARGFARLSPFGAAGVARPLTSEECWRGRGAQLPPDGNLFLPASRRESRREDLATAATTAARAAAAAAVATVAAATVPASTSSSAPLSPEKLQQQRQKQQHQQQKQLQSSSSSPPLTPSSGIKQEGGSQQFARGVLGGGTGDWVGKVQPGARVGSSDGRYGGNGSGDVRGTAMRNTLWVGSGSSDMYAINGNKRQDHGRGGRGRESTETISPMRSEMSSPPTPRGEPDPPSGLAFWDPKKGIGSQQQPQQQQQQQQQQQPISSCLNSITFADDEMGGLEFEGLGAGDANGGANSSNTDEDMNDLFRSFLVDGEDLLTVSSQGHQSNSSQSSSVPTEPTPPSSFLLRVGIGGSGGGGLGSGSKFGGIGGGGGGGGVGYDGSASLGGMRRRANTSPDCDDMVPSSTQGLRISDAPFRPISPSHSHRSPMGMLPTQVGSPPRRESRRTMSSNNMPVNRVRSGSGGGVTPSSPGYFLGSHSGKSTVGRSEFHSTGSLQLSSPWSSLQQQQQQQGYGGGPSSGNVGGSAPAFSSSHGVLRHEGGGVGGVPAASPSPSGAMALSVGLSGGDGGVEMAIAKIVDFSPTWDYTPGGAKLLICLAAPVDVEIGTLGPKVYFADRSVPAEMVSQTVLRCKVPPGPGIDAAHVPIHVEVPSRSSIGLRRTNSASSVAFDSGSSRGRQQGGVGVDMFEYRCPSNSPSNSSAPAMSRNGTPRTPAKRLTWETNENLGGGKGLGVRKREWGEVTSGPVPMESALASPMPSSSPPGWGQHHQVRRPPPRSSTPRERETPSWVFSSDVGGGNAGRDSVGTNGGVGGNGSRRSHAGAGWRCASADLGRTAAAAIATESREDSLGYPLLPYDGRECKIRIVERLGEIKGSRASSNTVSDAPLGAGGGGAGGFVQQVVATAATGGGEGSRSSSASGQQQVSLGQPGPYATAGHALGIGAGAGGGELDDTELNKLGDSDLERLLEQMWMQVMGQLTDLESELNALDARGYSVLHYTCLHNLGALVPVLVDRGADVNLRTGDGTKQTPLHLAAMGATISIVQELVKQGAMVDAIDAAGLTADKLATRCNRRDVALWLWSKSGAASAAAGHTNNNLHSSGGGAGRGSPTTPGQMPPWTGGVSPRGSCPPSPCPPPSPWGAGEGWYVPGWTAGSSSQQQQPIPSPSPRLSLNGTPPRRPVNGSPPIDRALGARGSSVESARGPVGGGAEESPPFLFPGWGTPSPGSSGGINAGGVTAGGDEGPGGKSVDGPWGLGIPPPGGGGGAESGDGMEKAGGGEGIADGEEEGWGGETEKEEGDSGSSTEQLLQDAFANLSLHEKCALSLHVSHQQQGARSKDSAAGGMDAAELSGMSKVIARGEEPGLREGELRAIMKMMGPSDLSELEDEVKVIQQNVRAWILRCNYKSLRKAAKTLQVAWRERQKNRIGDTGPTALSSPTSLPRMSSLPGMGGPAMSSDNNSKSGLTVDSVGGGSGPEPMDETHDAYTSGRDASGAESGSDAGIAGGLSLGIRRDLTAQERVTREERAAKALQAAARVMLARKGRFQRLAEETRELLDIQKRSRALLTQKVGGEVVEGGGASGTGDGGSPSFPQQVL